MSAVIVRFPCRGAVPRTAIESIIEQLVDLLDTLDQHVADLEPDDELEPDDWDELSFSPEWLPQHFSLVKCAAKPRRGRTSLPSVTGASANSHAPS